MTENGFAHGQWDLLFDAGQEAFRNTVVAATTGNHDRNADMNLYFHQPDTVFPNVYSFDYGNAHFMILSTEYDNDEELDQQIEWLRSEVDASDKGFQIVMLLRRCIPPQTMWMTRMSTRSAPSLYRFCRI